ncbi:hypothetical protein PLICRDRAFT_41457 [Plicaturopsis crispa FD-325 SS-3]|nr:hypothetical protein PLICRDRAFT_41457 [Plicaturopsis crispa FD-325 SS-3]
MPGIPKVDADSDLTSGQFPPIDSYDVPYSKFPKVVEGPIVWEARPFRENPETWIRYWTDAQIEDLENATRAFEKTGLPLTEISKEHFPISDELKELLAETRELLLNGRGFVLFKGLPVHRWSVEHSAIAYMGIGSYLGHFVSQNGKGHILGHVKDLGNDPTQIDKVRIYSTNARQFFHADDSDFVGLLCLHRAKEGGESDIVSSYHVWNVLQKERPDVAETLVTPNWYWDRKGEVSDGDAEYYKCAVYYYYEGKLISKWDPYFVKSLKRFSDIGEIPPLSEKQLDALQVLEDISNREALHMILEVGDIQLLNNNTNFHARTAYIDHPPPAPRRQLMRLWLSTPVSEGGWKLPFPDSHKKRRGGIQVNQNPHTSPLDGA